MAKVVIKRLQRQMDWLKSGVEDIRDKKKWSGERCRDSASFLLERLDRM